MDFAGEIWPGHGLDRLWFMKYSCIQLCYVHLFYRWYYGNINRQKAEKLLLSPQNKTGSFLVRISESHSDEYTISGSFPCFFSLTQSPSLSHSLSFECLETSSTSLPYSLVFLSYIISFFIFFLSHLQFSLWSAWRCSLHFINLIIFCLRYPLSAYPPSFQTSISLSISLSFHPTACNTILVFHVQLTKHFSVSKEE